MGTDIRRHDIYSASSRNTQNQQTTWLIAFDFSLSYEKKAFLN